MVVQAKQIKRFTKINSLEEKLGRSKELLIHLQNLFQDPQDTLPDVFVWMLANKRRVAYARLPASERFFEIFEGKVRIILDFLSLNRF